MEHLIHNEINYNFWAKKGDRKPPQILRRHYQHLSHSVKIFDNELLRVILTKNIVLITSKRSLDDPAELENKIIT